MMTLTDAQIALIKKIGFGRIDTDKLDAADDATFDTLMAAKLVRLVKSNKWINLYELGSKGLKMYESMEATTAETADSVNEEAPVAETAEALPFDGPVQDEAYPASVDPCKWDGKRELCEGDLVIVGMDDEDDFYGRITRLEDGKKWFVIVSENGVPVDDGEYYVWGRVYPWANPIPNRWIASQSPVLPLPYEDVTDPRAARIAALEAQVKSLQDDKLLLANALADCGGVISGLQSQVKALQEKLAKTKTRRDLDEGYIDFLEAK